MLVIDANERGTHLQIPWRAAQSTNMARVSAGSCVRNERLQMTVFDLLGWIVFGLIAGGVIRLLTPGKDRFGCLGTMALGISGSLVGGYIGNLLSGQTQTPSRPAGFLGAVLGGIVVLLFVRMFKQK